MQDLSGPSLNGFCCKVQKMICSPEAHWLVLSQCLLQGSISFCWRYRDYPPNTCAVIVMSVFGMGSHLIQPNWKKILIFG